MLRRARCSGDFIPVRRGWQDAVDVANFLSLGLVTREQLADYFAVIEGDLYRYPALDPAAFRRRIEHVLAATDPPGGQGAS